MGHNQASSIALGTLVGVMVGSQVMEDSKDGAFLGGAAGFMIGASAGAGVGH